MKNSSNVPPELNQEIIKELQRRVLKKEEQLGQDIVHVEDLIQALKEVTHVPPDEIDRIARNVQKEITQSYHAKITHQKFLKKVLIISALLISLVGTAFLSYFLYKNHQYSKITYTAVFTNRVDEKTYEPVDRLKVCSIYQKYITIYVLWKNLPEGLHDYNIKVYDGEKNMVWDSDWEFTSYGTRETWSNYRPKENVDKPGLWQFKITLDGYEIVDEQIKVTDEPVISLKPKPSNP